MKATAINNIRLEMSPEHKNSNIQSKVEWQMIKLQCELIVLT